MANVLAPHSVGNSIVTYLRNSYPQQVAGITMPTCSFEPHVLRAASQQYRGGDDAHHAAAVPGHGGRACAPDPRVQPGDGWTGAAVARSALHGHRLGHHLARRAADLCLDAAANARAPGARCLGAVPRGRLDAGRSDPDRAGRAHHRGHDACVGRVRSFLSAVVDLHSALVRPDPDQAIDTRRVVARQLALGAEA